MPRIRSLKPEFWLDRPFVRKVPDRTTRMLYMALWNIADEHARLGGDPHYIKGQCFPYEEDADLTPDVISDHIDRLAAVGKVVRYEVDGDPYLFLPRLGKHQRLETKVPSRLPPPPTPNGPGPHANKPTDTWDYSADPLYEQVSLQMEDDADESARDADSFAYDADKSSLLYVAGGREQGAGSKEQGKDFLPPTAPPPGDEQDSDDQGQPDSTADETSSKSAKTKKATKAKKVEPHRPDVDALCERLVELMVANECKPPTITETWRTEGRLLFDKDKRDFAKAMLLLEWSQNDEFWKPNIHSIPTFREKYDTLRQRANSEWARNNPGAPDGRQPGNVIQMSGYRQNAPDGPGTPAHLARALARAQEREAAMALEAAQ